jgi:N-acetylmuramoyl-L-alanine amidase-like protein
VTVIKSRSDWNARPWTDYVPLDWTRVVNFVTHYSGASRTQSVRSIQDYCMDVKGHSDIDYNEIVKDGVVYVGRADHVGGHTFGRNSTSYGICIIGNDGDATDADFQAVRERYDYACGRAGRALGKWGHRTINPGTTDCPGDEIQAWIDRGMPYTLTFPGDWMFAKIGDQGPQVGYLQRRIIRAGGTVGASGDDDQYGKNTAAGLAAVLGYGDGTNYGKQEMDDLDEVLRVLTAKKYAGGGGGGSGAAVSIEVPATTLTIPASTLTVPAHTLTGKIV